MEEEQAKQMSTYDSSCPVLDCLLACPLISNVVLPASLYLFPAPYLSISLSVCLSANALAAKKQVAVLGHREFFSFSFFRFARIFFVFPLFRIFRIFGFSHFRISSNSAMEWKPSACLQV